MAPKDKMTWKEFLYKDRESFGAYAGRYAKASENYTQKTKAFHQTLDRAASNGKEKAALTKLIDAVKVAEKEVSDFGQYENGVWRMNEGIPRSDTQKSFGELRKANQELRNFLMGRKTIDEVKVSDGLKKAYLDARTASRGVGGIMDNPIWGKIRTEGFQEALQQNWDEVKTGIQFLNEDSQGLRGVAFARVGATAAGGALAAHALLASKNKDGEDRGMWTRIAEFILGGGVAAAGVMAGRAR